jgi:hypothetical protein
MDQGGDPVHAARCAYGIRDSRIRLDLCFHDLRVGIVYLTRVIP